ncbi:lysophospholipase L1-like esterase [Natronobacillus azotifigens]|uniref:GDSL-type esterase/lipase family protein n=1 Tax=Natronobacillus azotifigens TaxID=472978 RepID=A0A9J6RAY5_9BACI|nr:GDSL-type esterase/lipase family protein [Natronobacillus azotifigens]MCZ0702526.1 GDSL-type esterase/lipase family protein [Natronobacillus azotifigens]
MTKRKKRQLIALLFFLFILAIIIFLSVRPLQIYQTTTTQPEEDNIQQVIEQVQEKDEEASSPADELSLNLREAVDQALNIFASQDFHITAIGDSLTQGVGDETNSEGYVGVLKNKLSNEGYRLQFNNFGRRGNRTDQLIVRLEEESALQRSISNSDIVLVTIGANDIMRIVRENFLNLQEDIFINEQLEYEERLNTIFEMIIDLNDQAHVFLIGFFNPFEGYFDEVEELSTILTSWNQSGEQLTNNYPLIQYIPIDDLFQIGGVNLLAEDNFHPNSTGYSLIASRVLNYLQPALEDIILERTAQAQ